MKTQHCFFCGEELPPSKFHDPYSTCGKLECDREARRAEQEAREEAHQRLDEDMGWEWGY